MRNTSIEWTDDTWPVTRGCSRKSTGCEHCYAEAIAIRFSGDGLPYAGFVRFGKRADRGDERVPLGWNGVVRLVPEHLADPLRWREPRRIFVNSMSDLFHEALTNQEIAAVFGVMAASPQHTFQVITKRAARMRAWFAWAAELGEYRALRRCGDHAEAMGAPVYVKRKKDGRSPWNGVHGVWPLPNVWLGVSVENQAAADERIPELLATPAAVRFLSCEPLLERVDLDALQIPGEREGLRFSALRRQHDDRFGTSDALIDWVIAGAESGRGARPCDVAWLRALRDQCAAAGVPFFLKQAVSANPFNAAMHSEGIGVGDGSTRKPGGLIGLPYLDGVQHTAFPKEPVR